MANKISIFAESDAMNRLLLTALLLIPFQFATADIMLEVKEGPTNRVVLTIDASGIATTDGDDNVFFFATPTDTFLKDGVAVGGTPTPSVVVNGLTSFVWRTEDYGGGGGYNSAFALFFNGDFPSGTVDLSQLNGTYAVSFWQFSDFNPGTYELDNLANVTNSVQNVGRVSLSVVPEPSAFACLGLIGLVASGRSWWKRR